MSEDGEGGPSHQGSTAGTKVAAELNPRGMLDQARVPESGHRGGTDMWKVIGTEGEAAEIKSLRSTEEC